MASIARMTIEYQGNADPVASEKHFHSGYSAFLSRSPDLELVIIVVELLQKALSGILTQVTVASSGKPAKS